MTKQPTRPSGPVAQAARNLSFSEHAFYSHTAPEPAGLAGESLQPTTAEWTARTDSHLSVLSYEFCTDW
jgi:hypothetical protein